MSNWRHLCVIGVFALAWTGQHATAAALKDPVTFESHRGTLNLILTARAAPVLFGKVSTTGWVYEACLRASATAKTCIHGSETHPYGGVWLKLKRNDTLNIRLVNKLPIVSDAKHCADNPDLANNPTNLHTHGLIVEPHRSTGGNDPYGDYIFVEVRNTGNHGNCTPPATAASPTSMPTMARHGHPDTDVADNAVEYRISLVNHPSGMFWFHPHMHGVALNQVTSGLAGVISVGEPEDECQHDLQCIVAVRAGGSHVLVLKDSEVLADGTLLDQQDPGFCTGTAATGEALRQGVCAGSKDAGFEGGHWFHTVNGQVYPTVTIGEHGQLWRFVNASASRSYDLSLTTDDEKDGLPLQIFAIDGISIDAAMAADLPALQTQFGRKMTIFRCPQLPGAVPTEAVCTRHIRMMPSSRVTVRVVNDKAQARDAVLRTNDFRTGPDADDWPAIDLASVHLTPPAHSIAASYKISGAIRNVLSGDGVLGAVPSLMAPGALRPEPLDQVQKPANARLLTAAPHMHMATAYAIDPELKLGLREDPHCANLAKGEYRRIYFGNPTPGQDGFGLATVVVGADGKEKPDTATPMRVFDPTQTTVCLTASAVKGQATTEVWELINVTGEDHNFHIHQTRFSLLTSGPTQPNRIDETAVLQDNVPVLRAADVSGCDGRVQSFASGACKPTVVRVSIPFTQIGDFVFHCHILEHEDGGMMARIRVVAPPMHQATKQ